MYPNILADKVLKVLGLLGSVVVIARITTSVFHNWKTRAAVRNARRGKVRSFATVKALMDDLNAPD